MVSVESVTPATIAVHRQSRRRRLMLGAQQSVIWPWRVRLRMLRMAGFVIDHGAFFEPGVAFIAGELSVGAGAYINQGCLIDARGGISIGQNTLIGPGVMILTATHRVMPDRPRAGPTVFAPITIGDGVWIGAESVILAGAIVNDGCTVAAGAVVRNELAPDHLYAGVPATVKRALD